MNIDKELNTALNAVMMVGKTDHEHMTVIIKITERIYINALESAACICFESANLSHLAYWESMRIGDADAAIANKASCETSEKLKNKIRDLIREVGDVHQATQKKGSTAEAAQEQ